MPGVPLRVLPGLPEPPRSWLEWAEACMQSSACRVLDAPQTSQEVGSRCICGGCHCSFELTSKPHLQARDLRGSALLQYLEACLLTAPGAQQGSEGLQSLLSTLRQLSAAGPEGAATSGSAPSPPRLQKDPTQEQAGPPPPAAARKPYKYARFNRNAAGGGGLVAAELLALVAVFAAYTNTSPLSVMRSLAKLEQHLELAEGMYKSRRDALRLATQAMDTAKTRL
jgi:hypothetical protein